MGDDLDHLLNTARIWLAAGQGAAIATVIETWGSAPRRNGSHAIIREDGLFEGSVSGGCVEGDVIFAARGLIGQGGGVERRDYGVANEMAWEVGLACGGQISVLIQSIDDSHFPASLIDDIIAARAKGRSIAVATDLETGRSTSAPAESTDSFVNIYAPRLRMMIVGAVHTAQSLVPLAELIGYQPLLVDPRDGFAAASRFADIIVDPRWPDEAFAEWRPDGATAIVTLTHDPKIDDPALVAALNSPAFYIASLGSRRTHARRIERLAELGFSPGQLARIQGPAGLAIGAVNPAEIALSIMAGATAALRRPA